MSTHKEVISEVLEDYLHRDTIDRYIDITGGDILSLLKRHITPIFIIGVDGYCVILNYKKGLVRIHVDGTPGVLLRRGAKLIDKPVSIDTIYRVMAAVETLDMLVIQRENSNE